MTGVSWRDFWRGFSEVWPMLLAYAPVSALWGAAATAQGLSPLEAILMSGIVYSGAGQFVAIDLLRSGTATSLLVFAVATVALRHVLMSASIARHITHFPALRTSILMFWLTDEAWAILERRAQHERLTPAYFLGASFPLWPTWILFAALGAAVGQTLGDGAKFGLDFAFAAMFIAVLAGFWKGPRSGAVLAVAALAACIGQLYVPGAWYILIGGAAGMMTAVAFHGGRETS